ncbi:MAG: hypothetical protein RJB26_290 [Pseudomonadota bacterium]|jgi:peptidoglycan/LPS O-acetylase OafA/YrhL
MKRLSLLDYSRLVAAFAVLCYHYFHNGLLNGKLTGIAATPVLEGMARYGYLGVELFFMISGYVIFFSARGKRAGDFLAARALRLYPAFWGGVVLTSLFAVFLGGVGMAVSAPQVLANLTMFPQWFGYQFVDGVYWTLQYEWAFYAAVFGVLLVGAQRHLETLLRLWPLWLLLTRVTDHTALPYADGYYAFFAAGALFAMGTGEHPWWHGVMLGLCAVLCVSFSLDHAAGMSLAKGIAYSPAVVSVLVGMFFVLFIVLGTPWGESVDLPGARWAGAITYPLYLVHAHIGYMVLSHLGARGWHAAAYVATFALVLALAWLLHRVIETRGAQLWRTVFAATLGRAGNSAQEFFAMGLKRLKTMER